MYRARASLKLAKMLFDLSGWEGTGEIVYRLEEGDEDIFVATNAFDEHAAGVIPVYDLGYVLRRFVGKGGVEVSYGDRACIATSCSCSVQASQPEDAVCLLAIALFQRGLLVREER